jgi:hypothetical protein
MSVEAMERAGLHREAILEIAALAHTLRLKALRGRKEEYASAIDKPDREPPATTWWSSRI